MTGAPGKYKVLSKFPSKAHQCSLYTPWTWVRCRILADKVAANPTQICTGSDLLMRCGWKWSKLLQCSIHLLVWPSCKETYFNCDNDRTQCIPWNWVCDKDADCADGSDESEDLCKSSGQCGGVFTTPSGLLTSPGAPFNSKTLAFPEELERFQKN